MTTGIRIFESSPFDVLVKNLFDRGSFLPLTEARVSHPVDIYETSSHLVFQIACTGINREDIDISIQGNTLKVNYDKEKEDDDSKTFLWRGIAKRSFSLGWKIDSKFDLDKAEASFKEGLLTIKVPFVENSKSKKLMLK